MSQTSSSSKTTVSSSSSDQDSRAITSCMDSEVLEITPLREMATNPSKVKKLRTRHAGRSQATSSGNPSQPSSSVPNREGSAYVHQAIARLVTRILSENHSVPGISVPLNQESASPNVEANPDVSENVETPNDNIQKSSENLDDIQNPSEKNVEPPVIDVDEEYSDNDLIANINPSIARRMMNRKGNQDAAKCLTKEKPADKKTRSEGKTGVETVKTGLSKGKVKT